MGGHECPLTYSKVSQCTKVEIGSGCLLICIENLIYSVLVVLFISLIVFSLQLPNILESESITILLLCFHYQYPSYRLV